MDKFPETHNLPSLKHEEIKKKLKPISNKIRPDLNKQKSQYQTVTFVNSTQQSKMI